MNTKTINAHSVPADASRALHGVAPFRVIAGRGIVDAHGRLVCTARCGGTMDAHGFIVRDPDGLTFTDADDNAHAIAHALNDADSLAQALRACVKVLDDKGGTSPQDWMDAFNTGRELLAAYDKGSNA
jgi:hypothetical protein